MSRTMRGPWASRVLHGLLLAIVCVGVYANNFRHEFQLDDSHVLTSNLAVRSLANIPSYFTDPGTFTSLRANVDYRPVLQVTYALNYAMGGYDTFWWHLTQIVLHAICALGLYALCRRVLLLNRTPAGASVPAVSERDGAVIAVVPLLAALLFAVHPTASGVVNYLSARSSLLTAAFLLPAIVLYMKPRGDERYERAPWGTALLFGLALFTKVEAIAGLAVFFLYDVWQTCATKGGTRNFLGDVIRTFNRVTLRRLWPMLAIAAVYVVIRQVVLAPFEFEDARRATGVSALDYLLTQTVVWWHYVRNWFAPVGLVADHGNYPVYRSLLTPQVALAVVAWLAIGTALLLQWRRRPYLVFLGVSALALLSPTSSIAPLAEMLNEHRPYLPIAVLSLAWIIPLGTLVVQAAAARPAVASLAGAGAALVIATLGVLTWQRNKVYTTQRAYLEDIVAKAPSGRALNNYGLLFMADGNYRKAFDLFTQAAGYTPYWHIVHINLALSQRSLGNPAAAQKHFDDAVRYDTYSGTALTYRGEHYLGERRYEDAARDFEAARAKSLEHYRLAKGLATAYAGMGDANRALERTREAIALDSAQAVLDALAIVQPFFEDNSRAAAGIAYFEGLAQTLPNTWWIHYNIGTLAGRLGDTERMRAEQARGQALKGSA